MRSTTWGRGNLAFLLQYTIWSQKIQGITHAFAETKELWLLLQSMVLILYWLLWKWNYSIQLWSYSFTYAISSIPAVPISFIKELKNQETDEGKNVTLRCELSKAGIPVEWLKGEQTLLPGEKYQMRHIVTILELVIRSPVHEDSGTYICVCEDQRTKAIVKIRSKTTY